MTTNSQLSTTKPNQQTNKEKTKETTRTGTESQKWRSHGGLSAREGPKWTEKDNSSVIIK